VAYRGRGVGEGREQTLGVEGVVGDRAQIADLERLTQSGWWYWDISTDTWAFSEGWRRIHGTTCSQMSSAGLLRFSHPDDHARIVAAFERVIHEGKPYSLEHRIRREDTGEVRWLMVLGERVEIDARSILRGVVQDITDRIRNEERMFLASEQFRVAFDESPLGSCIVGLDYRFRRVNPTLARMIGHEPGELVGRTVASLSGSQYSPEEAAGLRSLIAGEIPLYTTDRQFFRKDGSPMWAHVVVHMARAPSGTPLHFQTTVEDISERIAAESAIAARNDQLRILFATSPLGIGFADRDLKILRVNRALCAMLGCTEAEMIGRSVLDFAHVDDVPSHLETVADLQAGRARTYTTELRGVRLDGSTIWLRIAFSVASPRDGQPPYVIAFIEDVTKKRAAEARERQLETALRESQKLEALGELAGGIAHDFNNVLGVVVANAELAREDVTATHPARESLDEIVKASDRARRMVRQIMTFSRGEPEDVRPFRALALVEGVSRVMRTTLPINIALTVECPDDSAAVFGDEVQLHQVFMNLCTNAVQAIGRASGRIVLRIERFVLDPAVAVAIGSVASGPVVRVSVIDTGPGMDDATVQRIFEPFFTTKPVGAGTGLGLAVVHRIVRTHGGAITVDTGPGRGTTFNVYLPAADAPAEAEVGPVQSAAPRLAKGQHVLCVDDDDAMRRVLRRKLRRLGYQVSTSSSGEHALRRIRDVRASFDLVLTDLYMPGVSGLDVADIVRRERPSVPVLILTGTLTDDLRHMAQAMGVRGVIDKANTQPLGAVIAAILADPSATAFYGVGLTGHGGVTGGDSAQPGSDRRHSSTSSTLLNDL
jgi:PAS domain S-box-containing protein